MIYIVILCNTSLCSYRVSWNSLCLNQTVAMFPVNCFFFKYIYISIGIVIFHMAISIEVDIYTCVPLTWINSNRYNTYLYSCVLIIRYSCSSSYIYINIAKL